jgi:hypothetical protein
MQQFKFKRAKQMPNPLLDMTGQRFGTLTVLSRAAGAHEAKWLCRCDCGHERVYVGSKLRGLAVACKCSGGKDKDGMASREPRLHSVWSNMKDRCTRPGNKAYANYGKRGIGVCQEWMLSFSEFCRWAKENGWREGLELDRKDNNGNYEPSNCRFVTQAVNCRNKRSNRMIAFGGKEKLLVEWAEETGVPMKVLNNRLNAYGWSVERALSTPHRSVSEAAKNRFKEQICHL